MKLTSESRHNPRWMRCSWLGIGIWLAVAGFSPFVGFASLWGLGLALLSAPLLWVPLGISLVSPAPENNARPFLLRWAAALHPAAIAGAVVALSLPAGGPAVAGAALWFVQTLLLAGFGLQRLARHGVLCVEECAITAGLLYLPVGGYWLMTHAAGWTYGFNGLIVLLTAVHFHFAGFALCLVTGLVGRLVPWTAGRWRTLYRVAAVAIIVSPALVGLGIAGSRWLEVVAACLLATSVTGLGVVMLFAVLPRVRSHAARTGLAISAASVFATMLLAAWYALGEFSAIPPVPLDRMARWHGWLNAYGFTGIGLASLALVAPSSRVSFAWPPFSRLRGGRVVGADYFERKQLCVTRPQPARGLMDTLEEHRRPGFDPDRVAAPIRDFYERTAGWTLRVEARWQSGFRLTGRAFRRLAGRVGQLNLPLGVAEEREMISRLVDLSDAADGRANVRGWVRQFRATRQPVYVAAYSTHRTAHVAYMNIAFPLPGGNLTSILRMDHHGGTGIRLDTRPSGDNAGDEGVYLVGKRIRVRLPMQETITVTPAPLATVPSASGERADSKVGCVARHDLWLFGLHYLRLDYEMAPLSAT